MHCLAGALGSPHLAPAFTSKEAEPQGDAALVTSQSLCPPGDALQREIPERPAVDEADTWPVRPSCSVCPSLVSDVRASSVAGRRRRRGSNIAGSPRVGLERKR